MIIEIDKNCLKDIEQLKLFISSMGRSANSFRYFKSRTITVINNHLCTVLLLIDDQPIGYGHLDKDQEDVWFGIAIAEPFLGQGKGKVITRYLIDRADDLEIPEIKLSVDVNNLKAIDLYRKYGFTKFDEKNGVLFFIRKREL